MKSTRKRYSQSSKLTTTSLISGGRRTRNGFTSRITKQEKIVVLEGSLSTSSESLITFLQGIGLKPDVDFDGEETIISADMSQILDESLKKSLVDVMRRQIVASKACEGHKKCCSQTTKGKGETTFCRPPAQKELQSDGRELRTKLENRNNDEKYSAAAADESKAEKNGKDKLKTSAASPRNGPLANALGTEKYNANDSQSNEVLRTAPKSKTKPKKLKIVKHLKRWLVRAKGTAPNGEGPGPNELTKASGSKMSREIVPPEAAALCETFKMSSNPRDEVHWPIEPTDEVIRENVDSGGDSLAIRRRNLFLTRRLKGTVSVPFLSLQCGTKPNISPRKSSGIKTRTQHNRQTPKNRFHFSNNKMPKNCENDVKFATILKRDKTYDEHERVLENMKTDDVEGDVVKIKKRILFARAATSLAEDALSHPIDLNDLLWPSAEKHPPLDSVELVRKSSFYQKFLTSMNILKNSNRTDVCDRSAMTDEPLSKTYADFIDASQSLCCGSGTQKSGKWFEFGNISGNLFNLKGGESRLEVESRDLRGFAGSRKQKAQARRQRGVPSRSCEERVLKSLVNKVLEKCTGNNTKKGYFIKHH